MMREADAARRAVEGMAETVGSAQRGLVSLHAQLDAVRDEGHVPTRHAVEECAARLRSVEAEVGHSQAHAFRADRSAAAPPR
jgi:hypothetical protein